MRFRAQAWQRPCARGLEHKSPQICGISATRLEALASRVDRRPRPFTADLNPVWPAFRGIKQPTPDPILPPFLPLPPTRPNPLVQPTPCPGNHSVRKDSSVPGAGRFSPHSRQGFTSERAAGYSQPRSARFYGRRPHEPLLATWAQSDLAPWPARDTRSRLRPPPRAPSTTQPGRKCKR